MDFLANLRKLLGADQEQRRPQPQQRIQNQQIQGRLSAPNPRAVFQPVGDEVLLRGAVTAPGVQVEEDNFRFAPGGQYTALGNGQARIDNGYAPRGMYQEDSFVFPGRNNDLTDQLSRLLRFK